MKNFYVLTEALNYIEKNLCEPITINQLAKHCFVSRSSLEKLFRYALNISIKEYLAKRRITKATYDVVRADIGILDIAMKYQFNSPEVFSRAFKRVWSISPSVFAADNSRFTELFPKLNFKYQKGDDISMARKKVDLSNAYEFFKENCGKYVLCFDIKNLMPINEISIKAGDAAILETIKRINEYSTDDMMLFRIGGDEFSLVTGFSDISDAKYLERQILAMNDKPYEFEEQKIPLSLHCGITTLPESDIRFEEIFNSLHQTINESKNQQSSGS